VRPAELEHPHTAGYLTHQTRVLNLFGNGVVYHSQRFEQETEISGYVRLKVWIELDVADTDFRAAVYEVLADGSSVLLSDDMLRARYRESLREQVLVVPGEVNEYTFDGFSFFSRRIARGSRLRLLLSSPNTVFFQKNYNSGRVVADETAEDARTAHVTVYHDAQHPSFLEIPVVS
jgi:uncharacterized protein